MESYLHCRDEQFMHSHLSKYHNISQTCIKIYFIIELICFSIINPFWQLCDSYMRWIKTSLEFIVDIVDYKVCLAPDVQPNMMETM